MKVTLVIFALFMSCIMVNVVNAVVHPDPGQSADGALTVRQAAAVPKADFSPYEIILSRKPFGAPPVVPPGNANVRPVKPFIDDWRMCAITEDEAGTRVGLINIKDNTSYFLYIGEIDGGVELVDADYETESATLRKGNEEGQVSMNSLRPLGNSSSSSVSPSVSTAPDQPKRMTYIERLRSRRKEQDEERKREEKVSKTTKVGGDEIEKHLQEYNMELIRAGGELGPPLPIPLTPEQDAQLVDEGVLPPPDE